MARMKLSDAAACLLALAAAFLSPPPARAEPPDIGVQLAQLSPQSTPFAGIVQHRPPIGPGRNCDPDSLRDPYTALICTDDSLAEAWLTLDQADLALRFQVSASGPRQRVPLAGLTSAAEFAGACPFPADAVIVTAAMRAAAIPCVRRLILRDRASRLAKLAPDAREEANREIRAHIAAQKGLIELGLLRGRADGVYAAATRTAIAQLQRDRNLPPSGFMTNATLQAMTEKPAATASVAAPVPPPEATPQQREASIQPDNPPPPVGATPAPPAIVAPPPEVSSAPETPPHPPVPATPALTPSLPAPSPPPVAPAQPEASVRPDNPRPSPVPARPAPVAPAPPAAAPPLQQALVAPQNSQPPAVPTPPLPAPREAVDQAAAHTKRVADAATLKTEVDAGIVDLYKPGQDHNANWIFRGFPAVGKESASRLQDGWEFVSTFGSVANLGTGDWSGRKLTTVIIESYIRLKNDKAGQYSNLCYDFAIQSDADISQIKETKSFSCDPSGSADMKAWLASVNFVSEGKVR